MNVHAQIEALLENDQVSQGLGIELVATTDYQVSIAMRVTEQMTNGYQVCHGGVIFTLADSALAFSGTLCGEKTLAHSLQIDYIKPAHLGDKLTATASILHRKPRSIYCDIEVSDQHGDKVALVRGRQVVVKDIK